VFVTREAWKKFGPFTGTPDFVTEYDLWLKIARYKMPIILDKYFSEFRIETSSVTKTKTERLLSEDEKIVQKYTSNPFIISLHRLHNYGRRLVGELV
jgi:hypothetical protein